MSDDGDEQIELRLETRKIRTVLFGEDEVPAYGIDAGRVAGNHSCEPLRWIGTQAVGHVEGIDKYGPVDVAIIRGSKFDQIVNGEATAHVDVQFTSFQRCQGIG